MWWGSVCTWGYLFAHLSHQWLCPHLISPYSSSLQQLLFPTSFIPNSVSSLLSWFPLKFPHLTARLVVYAGLNVIRCWIHLLMMHLRAHLMKREKGKWMVEERKRGNVRTITVAAQRGYSNGTWHSGPLLHAAGGGDREWALTAGRKMGGRM